MEGCWQVPQEAIFVTQLMIVASDPPVTMLGLLDSYASLMNINLSWYALI